MPCPSPKWFLALLPVSTLCSQSLFKDIASEVRHFGASGSLQAVLEDGRAVGALYGWGTGIEPWVTDGTAQGSRLLRDIQTGWPTSSPTSFHRVGTSVLFFAQDDTNQFNLWRTDGSASGTYLVCTHTNSQRPSNAIVVGSALFYFLPNTAGTSLWVTHGTASSTRQLQLFASTPQAAGINSRLLFLGSDSVAGRELWIADSNTTMRLVDLCPGPAGSDPAGSPITKEWSGSLPMTASMVGSCGEPMAPRRAPCWSRT